MHQLLNSPGKRLLALLFLGLTPLLANGQDVIRVARLSSPKLETRHPIDAALEIARESLRHSQANINDYTAVFVKRCRVD